MIAIIDLDSLCYAIGNPNKVLDNNGIPLRLDNKFVYEDKTQEQLLESCDFFMNKVLTNSKCNFYVAYIKGKDTIKAKRLIDPNYKADRNKEQPKWWDFIKGYLIESWGAIEVNEIEVDDACVITRNQIENSFIICIDSDIIGLEGTTFNWKKNDLVGEWVTTTAKQAEYKFWCDMICGSHNNTKGIPRKGIKYCEKVFEESKLKGDTLCLLVIDEYTKHFGKELGIEEFYKNYRMLKILTHLEGFIIPEPIKYKKQEEKLSEEKGIFD